MQRLAWSARRCGRRNLERTVRQFASSSAGSEHDDFWTAAQTEAKTTPAYQQATQASSASPPPSADGDEWAVPGGFGPGRMPMGEAYRPFTTSSHGNNSGPPPFNPSANTSSPRKSYDPVFDMLSSTHISPVKQADVHTYKGTILVDIRQYFRGDDGRVMRTKKGISLTISQWRRLQAAMGDIDIKIREMEESGGGFAQDGVEGPGGRAT